MNPFLDKTGTSDGKTSHSNDADAKRKSVVTKSGSSERRPARKPANSSGKPVRKRKTASHTGNRKPIATGTSPHRPATGSSKDNGTNVRVTKSHDSVNNPFTSASAQSSTSMSNVQNTDNHVPVISSYAVTDTVSEPVDVSDPAELDKMFENVLPEKPEDESDAEFARDVQNFNMSYADAEVEKSSIDFERNKIPNDKAYAYSAVIAGKGKGIGKYIRSCVVFFIVFAIVFTPLSLFLFSPLANGVYGSVRWSLLFPSSINLNLEPDKGSYVADEAGVLKSGTNDDIAKLNDSLKNSGLSSSGVYPQLVVTTVRHTPIGESISDYAKDIAETYKPGGWGDDNVGLVYVISTGNEENWLYVGGGLSKSIPSDHRDSLVVDAGEKASSGDYDGAVKTISDGVSAAVLGDGKKGKPSDGSTASVHADGSKPYDYGNGTMKNGIILTIISMVIVAIIEIIMCTRRWMKYDREYDWLQKEDPDFRKWVELNERDAKLKKTHPEFYGVSIIGSSVNEVWHEIEESVDADRNNQDLSILDD